MRAGDVIPIELPETVQGMIEGIQIFRAKYSVLRGNHSLKVTEINQHEPIESNEL